VNVPAPKRNAFCLALSLVKKNTRLGVTAKQAKAADAHWALWETFFLEHKINPFVRHYDDPIPIIQVFAHCYPDGRATPNHITIRSGTEEDAVRVMGQAFAQLGAADIRKDAFSEIDFCLTHQFRCYKKEDAPPSRVKPAPILIVIFILHQAYASNSSKDRKAISDLITIAFYFLLRLGEYTGTISNDTSFCLQEVELHVHDRLLDTLTATLDDLTATTTLFLTFTTQKNGTKGEVIMHGLSGDTLACPIKAAVRRLLHLRLHKPSKSTPIASYFHNNKWFTVKAKAITEALRLSTIATSHQTSLHPRDISAHTLCAGGATTLLCGHIDHGTICMIDRWHHDAMMRYLHLQSKPLMLQFAPTCSTLARIHSSHLKQSPLGTINHPPTIPTFHHNNNITISIIHHSSLTTSTPAASPLPTQHFLALVLGSALYLSITEPSLRRGHGMHKSTARRSRGWGRRHLVKYHFIPTPFEFLHTHL
jgi:hypothetical protein